MAIYSYQFIALGLSASATGCLIGWFAQWGLFYLLRDLLPQPTAQPSVLTALLGLVIGLAVLLGFALPPLLRLKKVSALRVLRRDLAPLPTSAWLVYSTATAIIGLLVWRITGEIKMTLTILGTGIVVLILLSVGVWGLLKILSQSLYRLPLMWRFGLQGLTRHRKASISQLLAFSLTLTAMLLSFTVRTDLLNDWQTQLPDKAPNHFALNIFPDQKQPFEQTLHDDGFVGNQLYPIIKGRLVEINAVPVQKIVTKDSQGDNATHRDLSLTWANDLPEDNHITAGQWWANQTQSGLVSVEQKLADSLHIQVGDTLTFTIGTEQIRAKVTNLRSLRWDTMKPNFYMIFSPHTLDNYPTTYLTSFYVANEQKSKLNAILKRYPSVTLLEVDAVLKQIKKIITQVSQAVNYLLYFALLAGLTVLFASVYATLDERIHEGALLRTLGAKREFLKTAQWIEFASLGALSGLLAVILSETILYALYSQVIHIDYQFNILRWLIMPIAGALIIGLCGKWGLRTVLNRPPLRVLKI